MSFLVYFGRRQSVMSFFSTALKGFVCGLMLLTLLAVSPASAQPAGKPTGRPEESHPDLVQETIFLTIRDATGSYRLEAVVIKTANVQGRLPVALLTHGKPRLPTDMALIRAELLARQARDLAHRGYLAVGVVRRGFGRSGGTPGVATNAPFLQCSVPELQRYFDVETDDIDGALRVILQRPDAAPTGAIVIGGSVGGGVALALAARRPPALSAAINIAGAVRLTNVAGEVICPFDTPASALGQFGVTARVPTLWVYSENDSIFAPETARRAHAAFKNAGGVAELRIVPAVPPDGHNIMELPNGRVLWLDALDAFLKANKLATWRQFDVESAMQTYKIPISSRGFLNKYYSLYTPKALAQAPDGRVTYTANTASLAAAREASLAACLRLAKVPCRVIMENFSAVAR